MFKVRRKINFLRENNRVKLKMRIKLYASKILCTLIITFIFAGMLIRVKLECI